MRQVEILATYLPNNVVSWVIKKKLGTEYSHIAIRFYSEVFGGYLIYEANWKGVALSSEENWLRHGHRTVAKKEISFNDLDFRNRVAEMGKYLGASYGTLALFEILLGNVDLGKNKGFICSEVAYLWVKDLITINKPQEWITPKDIAKALGLE